jgi:leucyl-tRNA synthetase
MEHRYNAQAIETKWQAEWQHRQAFAVQEKDGKPKYYLLEMFPYPSGKIHMGHVRNYSIGDVVARYQRMRGFNVLHPMGWDAFGLPAENAAIQNKVHPALWTEENIAHMRRQLKRMGFSYDWERELATCDPSYYKWEQLFFLQMFERGLAYKRRSLVNWCGSCATVLANEQVEEGRCWRCHNPVEEKELEQWFLRITTYVEELLAGCDKLSGGWPEKVLTMQRNWMGKSIGAEIRFPLEANRKERQRKETETGTETERGEGSLSLSDLSVSSSDSSISVFTTRQDTVFGATFMSLAVEHPLVLELSRGTFQEAEVRAFVARVRAQSRTERAQGKEGVFTGAYCRNPFTGWRMPIYAANFVLMEYGTGAVMAVPAHDQRDFEFARQYALPIVVVIQPEGEVGAYGHTPLQAETMTQAYDGPGRMVAAGEFTGLGSEEGKEKVADYLEAKGLGKRRVEYRLRDWGISRQRYWGAPIPIVYCDRCTMVPVPEKDLPVVLPRDVELTGQGGSPLARHRAFVETSCPKCGGRAQRETDTMDTFVESSWYFARYACPREDRVPLGRAAVHYWMPVDQYIGGVEHAVLHLLYARFFTKVLRDLGWVEVDEPFLNLLTQGMVCKETFYCLEHEWLYPGEVEGRHCRHCGKEVEVGRMEKMSKSKRNVVEPDYLIEKYGADTVRLFCLFAAPPEKDLEWNDQAVEGISRFLGRLWRLVYAQKARFEDEGEACFAPTSPSGQTLHRLIHRTIKRVSDDIEERFHFNTAIAAVMELINGVHDFLQACPEPSRRDGAEADRSFDPSAKLRTGSAQDRGIVREALETAIILLFPFVPHITSELWQEMGHADALDDHPWPTYDPQALVTEEVTVVVQVNGKVRGKITVSTGVGEEAVLAQALAHERVKEHLAGKTIKKTVVVPGRLVSIAV